MLMSGLSVDSLWTTSPCCMQFLTGLCTAHEQSQCLGQSHWCIFAITVVSLSWSAICSLYSPYAHLQISPILQCIHVEMETDSCNQTPTSHCSLCILSQDANLTCKDRPPKRRSCMMCCLFFWWQRIVTLHHRSEPNRCATRGPAGRASSSNKRPTPLWRTLAKDLAAGTKSRSVKPKVNAMLQCCT